MSDDEYCASEDSVMMSCDPCQFDGTQKDAKAFCHECNEFLCQQCMQSHRKFQAFRQHHILRGDSMPRSREETKPNIAFKFCDNHQMNEVQFYCGKHKSVFCSLCKIAKHSACDCKVIVDMCKQDDQSKFYTVVKDIENIKKEFEQLKTVQIGKIDSTRANSKHQRAQLDSVRKEMNEYFDRLENEITYLEIKQESNVEELRENVAMYTDAINHIASLQENIDHVSKSNDKVAIFAAQSKLKKIHEEYTKVKNTIPLNPKTFQEVMQKILIVKGMCDNINKEINKITTEETNEEKAESEDIKFFEETFNTFELMRESEMNKSDTGANENESKSNNSDSTSTNVNINDSNLAEPSGTNDSKHQESLKEKVNHSSTNDATKKPDTQKEKLLFENLKIKNIFPISITSGTSDSVCDITGSLFLPDGSLVLCDHANSNVILLDKEFKLLHKLRFEGNVWDSAFVNTNEIIVTLKSQKSLVYIRVESGRLQEGMRINLKRVPWGIAVYKDNILTTFHNNPGNGIIEIRNKYGRILRNIVNDKHGYGLFASPFYVTVNQNNGNIYVTDGRKHTFTCLTFEGKPLYQMESEEFKWPRKVIVDDHGNCLLCASLANKIILIKNKDKLPVELKREKDDFRVWLKDCKRPQTVSIRWEDQTIIIGLNSNHNLLGLK